MTFSECLPFSLKPFKKTPYRQLSENHLTTSPIDEKAIWSSESINRGGPHQCLSNNHEATDSWVDNVVQRTSSRGKRPLNPTIQKFKDFIDNDAVVRMYAIRMFEEIPVTPPYDKDPTGLQPQARDYNHMLELMNVFISQGPQIVGDPATNGYIGFPINGILAWPMSTQSGSVFFSMASVNEHVRAILEKWKTYLTSPASQEVLNPQNGWTSPETMRVLTQKGNNGQDKYTFEELYKCPDPSKPTLGFQTWDEFFLREFQDGIRPLASPNQAKVICHGHIKPTQIIVHACESTPIRLSTNVKLYDKFWLKSQPYSLADMLNGADTAAPFVGGTVYQAFLSALSYHRWHAPVSGKVVSIAYVPGTYYSENYYQGFANPDGPDPIALNGSQPYIAEVATRAIITIEADDPKIGLIAGVFIGMSEVSSCDFWVEAGQRIERGQQIGAFHYGGSSYCLVFRPKTNLVFKDSGPYEDDRNNKKVNSLLAVAI